MIKLRILEWVLILDSSGGPNVITRILIRRRQKDQGQRMRCDDGNRLE